MFFFSDPHSLIILALVLLILQLRQAYERLDWVRSKGPIISSGDGGGLMGLQGSEGAISQGGNGDLVDKVNKGNIIPLNIYQN